MAYHSVLRSLSRDAPAEVPAGRADRSHRRCRGRRRSPSRRSGRSSCCRREMPQQRGACCAACAQLVASACTSAGTAGRVGNPGSSTGPRRFRAPSRDGGSTSLQGMMDRSAAAFDGWDGPARSVSARGASEHRLRDSRVLSQPEQHRRAVEMVVDVRRRPIPVLPARSSPVLRSLSASRSNVPSALEARRRRRSATHKRPRQPAGLGSLPPGSFRMSRRRSSAGREPSGGPDACRRWTFPGDALPRASPPHVSLLRID